MKVMVFISRMAYDEMVYVCTERDDIEEVMVKMIAIKGWGISIVVE